MIYLLLILAIVAIVYMVTRNSQASRGGVGSRSAADVSALRKEEVDEAIGQRLPQQTHGPHSPHAKYGELERHPPGAMLPDPANWQSAIGVPLNMSKAQLYGEAVSDAVKPLIRSLGKFYGEEGGKWQYIYEDGPYKVWYD